MNVALNSDANASGVTTNAVHHLSEEAIGVLAALCVETAGLGVEGAIVLFSAFDGVVEVLDLLLVDIGLESAAVSLAVGMVAVAGGVEVRIALGVVANFTFDEFELLAGGGGGLAEEASLALTEAGVDAAGGVDCAVEQRDAFSGVALVSAPFKTTFLGGLAIGTNSRNVHALGVVEAVESSGALVSSGAFFELGETLAGGVAAEALAIGVDSALVSDKAAHLGFLANVVLEGFVVVAFVE